MKKIKDSMLVGILGGLIGAVCMDISNPLLWRNKKSEVLYGHIAGSMIMKPSKLHKGKNFLIGQIFHMTVASSIGVGMVEILKKFGKDHHHIKGGFLSVALWSVLYNFGQRVGFYQVNPRLTKTSYSAIWNHLVYGLVTSNAIVSLADPSIFSKEAPANPVNNKAATYGKNPVQSVQPIYSELNVNDEKGTHGII